MKRIFFRSNILLLLVLFTHLAAAQEKTANLLQFRVSPLNLIDLRAATLQFGVQATIKNRVGISVDYGLPYKGLSKQFVKNPEYLYPHHDYFKIRGEIKYFMPSNKVKPNKRTKPYFSLEALFSPEEYRKMDDFIVKADGDYRYEYSDIKRRMWAGCLKFGLEYYFGQRFLLDAFVGPGLRWIEVDHQTFGERPEDYEVPVDYLFEPVDMEEGKFKRIHLGLNVKLGFVILK